MSEHTPGPWIWVDEGELYGCRLVADGVTTVCDDGSSSGEYGRKIDPTNGSDTERANARLIAVAPTMHALIARAVADRIDDEWLADARRVLAECKGGAE